ncbi:hypothetical protein B5F36_04595 [Anaerofilum sp. An201]|nr:hypothetical protein [Anaerofilum sp. An201]OUP04450.1 hypothetical protein B5F36_04595 [Anaerofilum sp. An201]
MRGDDLLDAVGQIDPDLIEEADRPPRRRAPVWRMLPAVAAACLLLALAAAYVPFLQGAEPLEMAGSSPQSDSDSVPYAASMPSEPMFGAGKTVVWYVEGDELQIQRIPPLLDPQDVFAAWRTANGIAEEVQLLSCTAEEDGVQLTVTANLAYCSAYTDGELLLESLRQTMAVHFGLSADACQITLE